MTHYIDPFAKVCLNCYLPICIEDYAGSGNARLRAHVKTWCAKHEAERIGLDPQTVEKIVKETPPNNHWSFRQRVAVASQGVGAGD